MSPKAADDYPHAWAHRSCPATAGQAAASGLPPMHTYTPCRNRIPCRRAQSPTMIRAHCQDEATPKQRRVGSQDRAWPARPPREPETPQQPRVWAAKAPCRGSSNPSATLSPQHEPSTPRGGRRGTPRGPPGTPTLPRPWHRQHYKVDSYRGMLGGAVHFSARAPEPAVNLVLEVGTSCTHAGECSRPGLCHMPCAEKSRPSKLQRFESWASMPEYSCT